VIRPQSHCRDPGSPRALRSFRRAEFSSTWARGKLDVDVDRNLEAVGVNAEVVRSVAFAKPVCTDPDDDKFLDAAGVKFVVSGDMALLRVATYRQVQVVSARRFLSSL